MMFCMHFHLVCTRSTGACTFNRNILYTFNKSCRSRSHTVIISPKPHVLPVPLVTSWVVIGQRGHHVTAYSSAQPSPTGHRPPRVADHGHRPSRDLATLSIYSIYIEIPIPRLYFKTHPSPIQHMPPLNYVLVP